MPTLYIITGPAGVGKSNISKKIAESSQKSALIEGDEIYHQVIGGYTQAWKKGNHLPTFLKICLSTIQIYLEDGFDVVFNYIIAPETFELIKARFSKYQIKFAVLITDEKTLLERDKQRPKDCQMKERCILLLNHFKKLNFDPKTIINTTNLTPDEIVKKKKKD